MEQSASETQSVKFQLQALVRLQNLDNEIQHRRRLIEGLRQKDKEGSDAVSNRQKDLAQCKQEMDELLKERRKAEGESKDKLELIKKLSGQIFDVKTNEAYNALQSEIALRKQENSLLEERILEMMLAEEEIRGRMAKAEAALKESEGHVKSLQAEDEKEVAVLDKQIQEFQAQWETEAQDVRGDYLDLYKRLRDAKGGLAMAKIDKNICSGCRLTIRPQAAIELQKYRSLLYCDNCARILYVE